MSQPEQGLRRRLSASSPAASTWLNSLERVNVIPSADQVIGQMKTAGRELSTVQADRPARDDGMPSDWLRHINDRGRGISDSGNQRSDKP